jgi:translation initiation factor 1
MEASETEDKISLTKEISFNQNPMSKKIKERLDGLVYSTNPEVNRDSGEEEQPVESLPKDKQKLRVRLDTRMRAGKVVTVVEGFEGPATELEALGKLLKTKCGTGGSVKEGLILIQGDYKEKVLGWLKDWGYVRTK